MGLRRTGCSWMFWSSTGVALALPILRSTSVLRVVVRRSTSNSRASSWMFWDSVARAVDDGGQDALATQVADLLADDLAGLGRHDRTGAHWVTSREIVGPYWADGWLRAGQTDGRPNWVDGLES